MADILRAARRALSDELERFRNRHFLEAAMAGSALLAMADEEVRFSELVALDHVLESVRELMLYDPHRAVGRFRAHVDALRADSEGSRVGHEQALRAVSRLRGDDHAASLLVRVCLSIAKADGGFSAPERNALEELCVALDLDPLSTLEELSQ